MKRFFLLAALTCLTLSCSAPPGVISWSHDLEGAIEQASNDGKPVLAYLYTDWCTYCAKMEETTFTEVEVLADLEPRLHWVKLNAEADPEGMEIRDQLGLARYPLFLLFDPDGEEIDQLQGYQSAEKLVERVNSLLTAPDSFGAIRQRALEEPDSVQAQYLLGERYLERSQFSTAVAQFETVIELDPKNASKLADDSAYFIAYALASDGQPDAALTWVDNVESHYPEGDVHADAAFLRGQIHYFAGRNEEAREVFADLIKQFPTHPYAASAQKLIDRIDAG